LRRRSGEVWRCATRDALADAAATLVHAGPFGGFRVNAEPKRSARFLVGTEEVDVDWSGSDEELSSVDSVLLVEAGQSWLITSSRCSGDAAVSTADGNVLAPMPGRVIAVEVVEGAHVIQGRKLLTLEAMKMEHTLVAPFDGVVVEMNVVVGSQVPDGAVLARIDAAAE
jgi:3-methylcrotonyl-CoA carboxylase alpha subunit